MNNMIGQTMKDLKYKNFIEKKDKDMQEINMTIVIVINEE